MSSKGNSLAMERMKEKDEQDRLARMNTKQKRGTPTVRYSSTIASSIFTCTYSIMTNILLHVIQTPESGFVNF